MSMTGKDKLDSLFINQNYNDESQLIDCFSHYCHIADMYAEIENSIAGVSDPKERIGYICFGKTAEKLNIVHSKNGHQVNSIWEDEVYNLIVPEDIEKRHIDELCFLQFLKTVPMDQKEDYYLNVNLRVKDEYGHNLFLRHRDFCCLS